MNANLERSLHDYEFVACKVINKEGLSQKRLLSIENEIVNQDLIQSEYCVKMRRAIETPDKFYIFMEYCNGGDLR